MTTSHAYDGEDILRETTDDGVMTSTANYIQGPAIDEPMAKEELVTSYYHADGLGSIVKLTDPAGSVVHSYRYDAWGNIEVGSATSGYAYTGREWDSETGLYFYRARYYDPVAGRFISEDPIGSSGGVNLYDYVSGGPVTRVDPFGLIGFDFALFDGGGARVRVRATRSGVSVCFEPGLGFGGGLSVTTAGLDESGITVQTTAKVAVEPLFGLGFDQSIDVSTTPGGGSCPSKDRIDPVFKLGPFEVTSTPDRVAASVAKPPATIGGRAQVSVGVRVCLAIE